jgi:hypothetical protein
VSEESPSEFLSLTDCGKHLSHLHVPKEIIARRIREISAGINQGRKSDHYLVVWEDYPLKVENGRRLNN